VNVERTTNGGERFAIRKQDGTTEIVITSPSSVASIQSAVKTFSRALKNLADK
jgi:hypothetical protein